MEQGTFSDSETDLCDSSIVDTCCLIVAKPRGFMLWRLKANVNYGLWLIIMCQWRFISCDKSPTLTGMVVVRRHLCRRGRWEVETLCFPLSFAMNAKLPLKTLY